MPNKKFKGWPLVVFGLLLTGVSAFLVLGRMGGARSAGEATEEIRPEPDRIENVVSTTGIVLPKNRLEVKPPVNGRVEELLVKEGEKVKVGQTLGFMSSTERAALLDAARAQGEESLKYWQEVYKAISLISPIDGEVIVATTQPGQSVTTADAVVVLSDQLIVRAQVDETDIGKVKPGQDVAVKLDAYPDEKINASVEHIYHESKTVNNVTVYEVDLLPEKMPVFFRSGMNATVDFIEQSKEDALLVPVEAVLKNKDGAYLMVRPKGEGEPVKRPVKTGISDYKNIEIVSGLDAGDVVIVKTKKYALPKSSTDSNPFSPFGARKKEDRSSTDREKK